MFYFYSDIEWHTPQTGTQYRAKVNSLGVILRWEMATGLIVVTKSHDFQTLDGMGMGTSEKLTFAGGFKEVSFMKVPEKYVIACEAFILAEAQRVSQADAVFEERKAAASGNKPQKTYFSGTVVVGDTTVTVENGEAYAPFGWIGGNIETEEDARIALDEYFQYGGGE